MVAAAAEWAFDVVVETVVAAAVVGVVPAAVDYVVGAAAAVVAVALPDFVVPAVVGPAVAVLAAAPVAAAVGPLFHAPVDKSESFHHTITQFRARLPSQREGGEESDQVMMSVMDSTPPPDHAAGMSGSGAHFLSSTAYADDC